MAMSKRLSVLCALVLGMSVGCGGGTQKQAAAPAGGGYAESYAPSTQGEASVHAEEVTASAPAPMDSEPAPAAPPVAAPSPPRAPSGASIAPAAPPAPAATSRTATAQRDVVTPTPKPRERPGLGTEWGETRSSQTHDVPFFRQDPDRPFAVAAMNYNDRAGVEALASFHRDNSFRDVSTAGGAITVAIHDGAGEPLEAVHVGERTYVIGHEGERYTIVLTNHTDHRFEAVATVDGLDVINGRPGTLSNRGYLLMPYATLEIDGFRQSTSTVAAFRFSRVAESYAAQTGSARNVGVIGVAFFSERGDSFLSYDANELRTRETASPFPGQDPRFARPPRR